MEEAPAVHGGESSASIRWKRKRWVGIYERSQDALAIVAWSGFGAADGDAGACHRPERVLIMGGGDVVGALDVEPDPDDPFATGGRAVLSECAAVLASLWEPGPPARPGRTARASADQ